MIRFRLVRAAAVIATAGLLVGPIAQVAGWGFWGHTRINHAAVLALPDAMRGFFYNHIDYLTEEAVMPDARKYALEDKAEGPKHYLDVEEYDRPLAKLPRTPEEARVAFPTTTLDHNGRLPWVILELHGKLTQAFREGKRSDILLLSADLGHYIADAHMPLHTSANHDGQLTGQKGVHALWEARLPETFGAGYDLRLPAPTLIADPTAEVWRIITSSHAAVDSVLAADKQLRKELGDNAIFDLDANGAPKRNRFGQPIHAVAYAQRFHDALHGMVARRMRQAVAATAAFWYTAWVQAGQPDLSKLDNPALTARNAPLLHDELTRFGQHGELPELSATKEF